MIDILLPSFISPYLEKLLVTIDPNHLILRITQEHNSHHPTLIITGPRGLLSQVYDIHCSPVHAFKDPARAHFSTTGLLLTDQQKFKYCFEALQTLCPLKINETPPVVNEPTLQVIGIAASTGGPEALMRLLNDLTTPLPILITQHMPANMIDGFYQQLKLTFPKKTIVLAFEGLEIKENTIYIAPKEGHLCVERGISLRCRIDPTPSIHHVKPAADPMLCSLAYHYPKGSVLGVILTGMGEDGLLGAQSIVDQSGVVIAQDESTSVVWGMPKAVIQAQLAYYVLPLGQIGKTIMTLIHKHQRERLS